jgi:hypothetical protein
VETAADEEVFLEEAVIVEDEEGFLEAAIVGGEEGSREEVDEVSTTSCRSSSTSVVEPLKHVCALRMKTTPLQEQRWLTGG